MQGERSECKLTVADVLLIREMAEVGIAQSEIGELFGIARSTVSSINSGRSWKSVRRFRVKKKVELKLGQGGCGKCHGFVGMDFASDLESERGRFVMREELYCLQCGSRRETGNTYKYLESLSFS
jgi:hypothetical protein